MGKIKMQVHRKDSMEDHRHRLADGSYTGGALNKPNADRTFPHTHLYQHDGKTHETGLAASGGDHTHDSLFGETAGPVGMGPKIGPEIPRNDHMDFVEREGSQWVVRSEGGKTLGKHPSKEAAVNQLKAIEANK